MPSVETSKEAKRKSREIFNERKEVVSFKNVLSITNTEKLFGIPMDSSQWLGNLTEIILNGIDFDDGNGKIIRNKKQNEKSYDCTRSKDINGSDSIKKVEVKGRCWFYHFADGLWYKEYNYWLDKNKEADEIILVGYDNIINLIITHIWKMEKNDIVRRRVMGDFTSFGISNKESDFEELRQYEINGNIKKELQARVDKEKSIYYPKLIHMMRDAVFLYNSCSCNKDKQIILEEFDNRYSIIQER